MESFQLVFYINSQGTVIAAALGQGHREHFTTSRTILSASLLTEKWKVYLDATSIKQLLTALKDEKNTANTLMTLVSILHIGGFFKHDFGPCENAPWLSIARSITPTPTLTTLSLLKEHLRHDPPSLFQLLRCARAQAKAPYASTMLSLSYMTACVALSATKYCLNSRTYPLPFSAMIVATGHAAVQRLFSKKPKITQARNTLCVFLATLFLESALGPNKATRFLP